VTKPSSLVGFDADAATEAALDVAGDDLLVSSEYTPECFQVLFLSERLIDRWGNVDDVMDVGEAVHAFMHDDFTERELYDEIYPSVSETYAFATFTDRATFVRVLTGDEGLYLSLAHGADVTPVVERVKSAIETES